MKTVSVRAPKPIHRYILYTYIQRKPIEVVFFGWSAVLISFYVPCNKNSVVEKKEGNNTDTAPVCD